MNRFAATRTHEVFFLCSDFKNIHLLLGIGAWPQSCHCFALLRLCTSAELHFLRAFADTASVLWVLESEGEGSI